MNATFESGKLDILDYFVRILVNLHNSKMQETLKTVLINKTVQADHAMPG